MSRLKNFTRSLLSGYLMLGANILYTLASVPVALHYLNKPEFGLWALTTQIAGYISLIDAGMSSSISRILIDHKDDRSNGDYGGTIKTGALVGLVQGVLIGLAGLALSLLAGPLLKIPLELRPEFFWLMSGQAFLSGINFATRIFSQLLIVHQRQDITNYGATLSFFGGLAAMWAGFAAGMGVYSFLVGLAVMVLVVVAANAFGCIYLRLFPRKEAWGKASRARFRELFALGQGLFLISIGSQIINTSQTVLLTRLLGLETAATWTVCTRAYTMLTMVIWRIMDYSAPGLSEMVVRNERDKFKGRMRDITLLTVGLSVLAGTIFAITNSSFVYVWSSGKMSWPVVNDVLLALWLVACSATRVQNGLPILIKELHFLKFIYLIEGSVFIVLNLLAYRAETMTLMLVFSLACTMTFSFPYSLGRVREYFGIDWRELHLWFRPTLRLIWRFVPVAMAVWWLGQKLPERWQFVLDISVGGIWGLVALLKYGLGEPLRVEIQSKIPNWLQKFLFQLN